MQQINEDIKSGNLKSIYLLYGEEAYLIRQYRDKLEKAALGDGDAMNLNRFEGKGVNVSNIIDIAETMPFFAQRRVVVLQNTELLKSGGEALAEYLAEMSAPTVFILEEATVDKRSKLYKTITKVGCAVEFGRQNEQTLKKWILGILRKEQKQITGLTLDLFLQKTGDDMDNIRKELEKLICYCLDKEVITSQDVETICVHQIQNHIFDMITAIAAKQQKQALQMYYDLLALREPPMRILFLISRQFHLLLQVKELVKKGYSQKQIAEKVGLQGFVAGKYMNQAAVFSQKYLQQAVEDCIQTEYQIKSGKMTDQLGVELLIIQYSKKGTVS